MPKTVREDVLLSGLCAGGFSRRGEAKDLPPLFLKNREMRLPQSGIRMTSLVSMPRLEGK